MRYKYIFIMIVWIILWAYFVIWTETTLAWWTNKTIYHKWYSKDDVHQKRVQYARKVSWWDWRFMNTLDWESWFQSPTHRSSIPNNRQCVGRGWYEDSHWFCQLNRCRHRDVVDNPKFKDPYRQIEQCYKKYKSWTKFYWYKSWRFYLDGWSKTVALTKYKENTIKWNIKQRNTWEVIENKWKKCVRIDRTDADYIQIDTIDWKYIWQVHIPKLNRTNKIFKCWNK